MYGLYFAGDPNFTELESSAENKYLTMNPILMLSSLLD